MNKKTYNQYIEKNNNIGINIIIFFLNKDMGGWSGGSSMYYLTIWHLFNFSELWLNFVPKWGLKNSC